VSITNSLDIAYGCLLINSLSVGLFANTVSADRSTLKSQIFLNLGQTKHLSVGAEQSCISRPPYPQSGRALAVTGAQNSVLSPRFFCGLIKHVRPYCVRTPPVWDWSSNLGKDWTLMLIPHQTNRH